MREPWMRPEEWLCILACETPDTENYSETINQVIRAENVDIDKFKSLCMDQCIVPQYVSAVLNTDIRALVDDSELTRCLTYKFLIYREFAKHQEEVLRIQNVLEAHDIHSVLMKGISYFPYAYPRKDLRQLGDIDLIVDSSQLVNAVHLLQDIGYQSTEKNVGWTDEMYEEEMHWNVHIAVLSNGVHEIELHSTSYYYTGLNLMDVFDRRTISESGIVIPCKEDVFLIACLHAWHHFPKREAQIDREFIRIRNLLDVVLTYRMMRRTYSDVQILKIATQNHVSEVIKFIVSAAHSILEKQEPTFSLTNEASLIKDWEYQGEKLSATYRYLRYRDTVSQMNAWFARDQLSMQISPFKESLPQHHALVAKTSSDRYGWSNNILKMSTLQLPSYDLSFRIGWLQEGLRIDFYHTDNIVWKSDVNNAFDPYSSYIMIRYSLHPEDEAKILIIQRNSMHVSGYLRSFKDQYFQETVFESSIHEVALPSLDEFGVIIPWSVLGMQTLHVTLLMDIQARVVFDRNNSYVEISWGSGNNGALWNEYSDSRFLIPAVFLNADAKEGSKAVK